jgi:hypothetical protein
MLHAFFVFVTIERRRVLVGIFLDLSRETARDSISGNPFFRSSINFHSIAGRKQQCFRAPGIAQNALALAVTGEAFACLHVCGVMTQANAEKSHGNDWL